MGPQQQPSGGKLKQRMVEKKKDEMAQYMGRREIAAGHVRSAESAEDAAGLAGSINVSLESVTPERGWST